MCYKIINMYDVKYVNIQTAFFRWSLVKRVNTAGCIGLWNSRGFMPNLNRSEFYPSECWKFIFWSFAFTRLVHFAYLNHYLLAKKRNTMTLNWNVWVFRFFCDFGPIKLERPIGHLLVNAQKKTKFSIKKF